MDFTAWITQVIRTCAKSARISGRESPKHGQNQQPQGWLQNRAGSFFKPPVDPEHILAVETRLGGAMDNFYKFVGTRFDEIERRQALIAAAIIEQNQLLAKVSSSLSTVAAAAPPSTVEQTGQNALWNAPMTLFPRQVTLPPMPAAITNLLVEPDSSAVTTTATPLQNLAGRVMGPAQSQEVLRRDLAAFSLHAAVAPPVGCELVPEKVFSWNPILSFPMETGMIHFIRYASSSGVISAVSDRVRTWTVGKRLEKRFIEEYPGTCFRAGYGMLVIGQLDGALKCISLAEGKERILSAHSSRVNAIVIVKDLQNRKHIVSGSSDKSIALWDADGNLIKKITAHDGPVTMLCTVERIDGKPVIVSTSSDKTIKIWDLNRELIREMDFEATCLASYKSFLFAVSPQGVICVWKNPVAGSAP